MHQQQDHETLRIQPAKKEGKTAYRNFQINDKGPLVLILPRDGSEQIYIPNRCVPVHSTSRTIP